MRGRGSSGPGSCSRRDSSTAGAMVRRRRRRRGLAAMAQARRRAVLASDACCPACLKSSAPPHGDMPGNQAASRAEAAGLQCSPRTSAVRGRPGLRTHSRRLPRRELLSGRSSFAPTLREGGGSWASYLTARGSWTKGPHTTPAPAFPLRATSRLTQTILSVERAAQSTPPPAFASGPVPHCAHTSAGASASPGTGTTDSGKTTGGAGGLQAPRASLRP